MKIFKQAICPVMNFGHCSHPIGEKSTEVIVGSHCKFVENTYEITKIKCCLCEKIETRKKLVKSRKLEGHGDESSDNR